jgi:SulP family sulfate permease
MAVSHPGIAATHNPFSTLIADLVAGLICGFLAVVLSIGHGGLLFVGPLSGYLPIGIGMALFATVVVAAIGALTSSTRGLISIAQDIPAVALSAALLSVASALPPDASEQTLLVTVVVAAGLATALTGLFSMLLGHFRLGRLIRFAPYPVVGGFLAGTGWLIMIGGIGLVINQPFSFQIVPSLMETATLIKLALTAGFVLMLVLLQRGNPSPLQLPIIILVALFAFNAVAFGFQMSTDELRTDGWLVELPEDGNLWPPISPDDLALVDWRAVAGGLIGLPAVALLTVAAVLMNATGIELDTQRDIDLDRELKSVGLMNLVAGGGAGFPGYCSISLTVLAARLNALHRITPLIVAALAGAALIFGNVILDRVPTILLGGFLVWVGGSLLVEWLFLSYRRLELREYLVIPLIFVIIVGVDFAIGVLCGLLAAVVLFAFEYGRLDIVRHEMSGARYHSSVETTDRRRQALETFGSAILIVRLQGFLFFGTADGLRRRIHERMRAEPGRVKFLVIDFRRVTGIDSSSVLSFIRLHQTAAREDFVVVLAGASTAISRALRRGGLGEEATPKFRFEADLERGLKWCEDQLLSESTPELLAGKSRSLNELLSEIVGDPRSVDALSTHFARIEAEPGTRLIEQGSPSDDIILVESGYAAVELASDDASKPLRLATIGPGAIVGEISFYLHEPRTASIVVEERLVAWKFTREALARLQSEAPEAALDLHRSIAAMLARRLGQTNRLLRILAD